MSKMENHFCVYVHISPNNKLYFGITSKTPNSRWRNGLGYYSKHFKFAIQKYGWGAFQHIILFENLSREVACECEKYLIAKYDTTNQDNGYNLSAGGDCIAFGCHFENRHLPPMKEITKQKIRKTLTGTHRPAEVRRKISESHKGKKLTEIHRQHLGDINRGRIWINNGVVSKMIKLNDLQNYLDLDYTLGRIYKRHKNLEVN